MFARPTHIHSLRFIQNKTIIPQQQNRKYFLLVSPEHYYYRFHRCMCGHARACITYEKKKTITNNRSEDDQRKSRFSFWAVARIEWPYKKWSSVCSVINFQYWKLIRFWNAFGISNHSAARTHYMTCWFPWEGWTSSMHRLSSSMRFVASIKANINWNVLLCVLVFWLNDLIYFLIVINQMF